MELKVNEIYDMSNAFIEHSIVISNFVSKVGHQINDGFCKVFADNVKYKWAENGNVPVVPDVSINCDIRNRRATTFMGVPKFIMEVLSESTEKDDRIRKMELYRKVEVAEYWIVNWRLKTVEIYLLNPIESSVDETEYILYKTVTESNKEELQIMMFPHLKITFDELFEI